MCAAVSEPPKLPEQFAPEGPKLSRFRIVPPPPLRPRLLPDEAKFAFRLSVLSGCAEFAAWSQSAPTRSLCRPRCHARTSVSSYRAPSTDDDRVFPNVRPTSAIVVLGAPSPKHPAQSRTSAGRSIEVRLR